MKGGNGLNFLIIAGVLFMTPMALSAQEPNQLDQDEPLRLKADLVTVNAAVADRDGHPISTLTASDFTVYEDGVKQKIAHFARTEEPFSVMLMLDISGSTLEEIGLMKQAAKSFLSELRGGDRVGVMVFAGQVELIADLTSNRARLEAAIDRVSPAGGSGSHRFNLKTGTAFYDALYLAAEKSPLRNVTGRKAIVCMSDGVDSISSTSYRETAGPIERLDAPIYFLELNTEDAMLEGLLRRGDDPGYINFSRSQLDRYYDTFDPRSSDRGLSTRELPPSAVTDINKGLYRISRRELRELSERTGGRVYPVNGLTDLSAVYKQVAGELRSQYTIGYYPANDSHDGQWRSIRVEVRGRDAKVRVRTGYWAPSR
jgi:Ca-activated chloride channel homolog